MQGDPVIPAPHADDDDDVAWALQTAAVQWQRGQRADAVVWLRRAVDASINAGRAERTRELTRLAANVADRLVSEALAVPDSRSPPARSSAPAPNPQDSDVDELLARPSGRPSAPGSVRPRAASASMSDIPVEFDADDAELIEDADDFDDDLEDDFDDDDHAPTLPPKSPEVQPGFRHELSSRDYEYEEPNGTYVDAESVYDEGSTLNQHRDDYEPLDDDTESIVEATELLSDRPSPINRSSPPGRGAGLPSSHPPGSERASTPGQRPSGGVGARGSDRAVSSRAAKASDRAPLSSGRPPNSAYPPASSGRPPASSGRPPASSGRPPASSGRPPAQTRSTSGSQPATYSSIPPSSGNQRDPGSDRAGASERPRSSSDRPVEPIITAEELFRQKAQEKAESERPPEPALSSQPPPNVASEPPPALPGEPPPSAAPPSRPIIDSVSLDTVRGLQDLPEPSQLALARSASLTTLSTDDEVGSFGAALVTRGRVGIMPSIADVASSVAKPGEIVFTRGTLSEGVSMRVVALENDTSVASWSEETLQKAMADCPWVADELRIVADRFQAEAGAVLGPLGDRLDDTLRDLVMSRLEVRAFGPGELIVEEGKQVPGLHVVGGGRVDIASSRGDAIEASPGEFLFAAEVLGAGRSHATARAGKSGALVLFAPRSVAHELLLSVPTLIEILAG
jgi:hypothetical protein